MILIYFLHFKSLLSIFEQLNLDVMHISLLIPCQDLQVSDSALVVQCWIIIVLLYYPLGIFFSAYQLDSLVRNLDLSQDLVLLCHYFNIQAIIFHILYNHDSFYDLDFLSYEINRKSSLINLLKMWLLHECLVSLSVLFMWPNWASVVFSGLHLWKINLIFWQNHCFGSWYVQKNQCKLLILLVETKSDVS